MTRTQPERFGGIAARSRAHVERATVIAAEHARVREGVGNGDLVEDVAAVAYAQATSRERARDPDGSLGVEADAVGYRTVELCEQPPSPECAATGDCERAEPPR